jgi:hypothetical protein
MLIQESKMKHVGFLILIAALLAFPLSLRQRQPLGLNQVNLLALNH